MIREIVIVQNPFSACVPANYEVVLSVRAEGRRPLSYQWFTADKIEVPGATEADLKVRAHRSQLYVCRVNDQFCNCKFSDWAKVKVLDVGKAGLPAVWHGGPHIAVHPKPQAVRQGGQLALQCCTWGIPAPSYQWYHNGCPLEGQTSDTLQVDRVTAEHRGTYLCSVSNVLEERWSEPADIDIVSPDQLPTPPLTAADKVALLIGNLNYSNHPTLMAPIMDVQELAHLLHQLGFRVVSLLDLTRDEMLGAIQMFIQLLDKGVYGLFYYAGHGYERSGRNYLVAVDAPQLYRPENCVCVQRVMHSMQQRRTALNVILLDTCRKWLNHTCLTSDILPSKPIGNTVYGYATCEDAEAFEVQDGGKSTGIFTKYLNKHLLQAGRITRILELVSEDLGRDPLVKGKQVVEIKHTLKEPRSLSDLVHTTGHTRELQRRDARWRWANELPPQRQLRFPGGVEVEVSFSAHFSNVMVAFAAVKCVGPKARDLTLTLRSTPSMGDIFSGPGGSDEMGSSLLHIPDHADCTLRLCALQKLQGPLVIEVDLRYTDTDSMQRVTESRWLDVGQPLVASCMLDRQRPEGAPAAHSMTDVSNTKQPLQRTAEGPCRPMTRKAECVTKSPSTEKNVPEENDENEPQGCTPFLDDLLTPTGPRSVAEC